MKMSMNVSNCYGVDGVGGDAGFFIR